MAGSGALDRLVETARDYARHAASDSTLRAYAGDWAQFARWCRRRGTDPLPPSPQLIGLYIADLAAPQGKAPALSVASIERRLSGLGWGYAQRGLRLDRQDRHIASVLAGIRRRHARPPVQKEAILPEDIRAMTASLPHDLRGLRDRAILLIGFAGGLRRSEIVSLDHSKDDTPDSGGWVEVMEGGALITLRGKTGWREVEVARGSSDQTCPVHALTQWLHFAKIDFGPIFTAVTRDGKRATETRLSDKHVARLIKQTVLARRPASRPARGRAAAALLRPQLARRPRQQRRGRGAPCAKAPRPCQRRDDPPLSAPPRQVPREPDQGRGAVRPLPCRQKDRQMHGLDPAIKAIPLALGVLPSHTFRKEFYHDRQILHFASR
ncbi:Tyrosine recombinase XerC [Frigidibacter albus]